MRVSPTVVSDLAPADQQRTPLPANRGLVLLIEDDDLVATIVERILTRMGRQVVRARDGAAGAQRFAENEASISIVMLDCCLPDIDGVRLGRALRHIVPGLPLLLTSGWDHEAARALAAQGPTAFLPKPFLPAQLEAQIAALMQAKC